MKAAVDRAAECLGSDDPRVVREPDSNATRSIFAFHEMSGTLGDLARDARLVYRAQQILGSEVAIHQSRINFKRGGTGQPFAWHSDFETWHAEDGMPAMRALSAMIALTPNTESNGPLMVMPGTHKLYVATAGSTPEAHYETSLRKQEYGVPDATTIASLESTYYIERILSIPGDVALFDCNILHGSLANLTSTPRSNGFVVYDSVDNRPRVRTDHPPRPLHVAAGEGAPAVVPLVRDGDLGQSRQG